MVGTVGLYGDALCATGYAICLYFIDTFAGIAYISTPQTTFRTYRN